MSGEKVIHQAGFQILEFGSIEALLAQPIGGSVKVTLKLGEREAWHVLGSSAPGDLASGSR